MGTAIDDDEHRRGALYVLMNSSAFGKRVAVSYPKIPPPSDPYNRAVNFIHFFQIYVQKCAKNHIYTIISNVAENCDISKLQCNI